MGRAVFSLHLSLPTAWAVAQLPLLWVMVFPGLLGPLGGAPPKQTVTHVGRGGGVAVHELGCGTSRCGHNVGCRGSMSRLPILVLECSKGRHLAGILKRLEMWLLDGAKVDEVASSLEDIVTKSVTYFFFEELILPHQLSSMRTPFFFYVAESSVCPCSCKSATSLLWSC